MSIIMFYYVTSRRSVFYTELYKYLNYKNIKWVGYTKICTDENYLLYGISS